MNPSVGSDLRQIFRAGLGCVVGKGFVKHATRLVLDGLLECWTSAVVACGPSIPSRHPASSVYTQNMLRSQVCCPNIHTPPTKKLKPSGIKIPPLVLLTAVWEGLEA